MKQYEESYLTLFSEGADGDGAAGEGTQADVPESADAEREFDELVKGKYKDAYTKRTQSMINKRFKETKDLEAYRDRTEKLVAKASEYFGTDDADEIIAGMERSRNEREAEDGRLRMAAALGAADEYRRMISEADEVKAIYPSFDLERECENSKFPALIAAGIGVRGAYEAIHHDEIVAGAMQYAADRVYAAARSGIAATSDRLAENGTAGGAAIDPKRDVASMSERDIRRILKRVQNGEKIKL